MNKPDTVNPTYCTICQELTFCIQPEARWCSCCGSLYHASGKAWFCTGERSTPRLVDVIRENEGDLTRVGTLNAIRHNCGLGAMREGVVG